MFVSTYSPNIHTAARCTFDDLIDGNASINFSIINLRNVANFCIASRIKINTSVAPNSFVSDKNSTKTGMTVAATSGNLIEQLCNVRTNNCRYFPVSSCSILCVFDTSFLKLIPFLQCYVMILNP